MALEGIVWGRGAGEGIGLSGHKNEYKAGVRIGNWVEEQFGREAPASADTLKVSTGRARTGRRVCAHAAAMPSFGSRS